MEKEKGKIFYEVSLIKNFRYPKAMLEKGYEQGDAIQKAHNDVYKIIHEIANNKFEEIDVASFFKSEVKEDKGWKLRDTPDNSKQVDLEDIIMHFASADFEKKYGILNIEENPDIFEFQAAIPDAEIEEGWFLTEKMDRELSKLKVVYREKLRKFVKATPTQKRFVRRPGSSLEELSRTTRRVSGLEFNDPFESVRRSTRGTGNMQFVPNPALDNPIVTNNPSNGFMWSTEPILHFSTPSASITIPANDASNEPQIEEIR